MRQGPTAGRLSYPRACTNFSRMSASRFARIPGRHGHAHTTLTVTLAAVGSSSGSTVLPFGLELPAYRSPCHNAPATMPTPTAMTKYAKFTRSATDISARIVTNPTTAATATATKAEPDMATSSLSAA